MSSWMESRWRHQEGGGHPGQQYGEQQCCRGWCSWEMSDSNHSIPDKAAERPVRINANKSGMWAGMPCAIESNFYILERQPSDTILDTGRQHSERGADTGIEDWGILLNWSPTIRHLKADNSPILYLEAVEAVKKLLCAGVYATLCLYLLQWAASCAAPAQAVQTGAVMWLEWGSVVSRCSEGADVSVTLPVLSWTDRLQVTQEDQYKLLNRKCEISFQFCAHEHLRSFPI